jgi:two-component system sensor histidine kinase AtoS
MKFASPISFRLKLIFVILAAIVIPVLTTGYFMIDKAEEALLKEKEKKLYSIAKQLDLMLNGTFDDYLGVKQGQRTREEKIAELSQRLSPLTDRVAEQNPGIGVGYYSKELDAVLTYGPSKEMKDKIGFPISHSHPGRQVMEKGIPIVYTGKQVRGDIMNSMVPLKRGGMVIGYVWANELTSDVDSQLQKMEHNILLILLMGMGIGMMIALNLASRLGGTIDKIIHSIDGIGYHSSYRLPVIHGVLGKIPTAINNLLDRLAESKTHTEAIISSVSDGIITVTNQGIVTEWNQAATQITGYSREEMIGQMYYDMVNQSHSAQGLFLNTWKTGEIHYSIDTFFVAKSGETIPVNLSSALLREPGGQKIGFVVVFRDLREKRRMEEQMVRADRLKALGELAAGMAHEIRNPLTSIKAFSQITEESMPEDDPNREYMGVIVKEVERINGLVEQLLLFGKPSIQIETDIEISELIWQSLLLMEHDIRKKNLQVIQRLEPIRMVVDGN